MICLLNLPINLQDTIFYASTYFYVGKQEISADGSIGSADIKRFNQHLIQAGNNLKGLCFSPYQADSLPGKYSHSYRFSLSYMVPSDIDLRNHRHLRLLQFDLDSEKGNVRNSLDYVLQWFNLICGSVTSKSLAVEVRRFHEWQKTCDKIQDTLLALNARIETFSVYLSSDDWVEEEAVRKEKMRKLFSGLYKAGVEVIVQEDRWMYEEDGVCHYILTYLLY